jgi:hypothetical protein
MDAEFQIKTIGGELVEVKADLKSAKARADELKAFYGDDHEFEVHKVTTEKVYSTA